MKKRLEDMTLDEVEDLVGPGALVPVGDVWLSRRWQCGRCEKVMEFYEPAEMPKRCECGSVVFVKLPSVLH
jgi:hypothetical protein